MRTDFGHCTIPKYYFAGVFGRRQDPLGPLNSLLGMNVIMGRLEISGHLHNSICSAKGDRTCLPTVPSFGIEPIIDTTADTFSVTSYH